MRAVVRDRYGPPSVIRVANVVEPAIGEHDVLVRVEAVSLNRSDWETLVGSPPYVRVGGGGLFRPKRPVLGTDFVGTVTAVGPGVTRFGPGDRVLGDTMYGGSGTLADAVRVPEAGTIAILPDGMDPVYAAALPQAALLALQGIRARGGLESGHRLLVNGAGGGGGTFAVQLAASMGAEVTAVDRVEKHRVLRDLGAVHTIDHRTDDYTRGARYDRILDFVGSRSLFANRRALAPGGVYLVVGGPVRRLLAAGVLGGILGRRGKRRMGVLVVRPNVEDLAEVVRLTAEGSLRVSIGGRFPLEGTAGALAILGAGEAVGKLVIEVATV